MDDNPYQFYTVCLPKTKNKNTNKINPLAIRPKENDESYIQPNWKSRIMRWDVFVPAEYRFLHW